MTQVGLVGCVKSKRSHAAPAAELYTSPLFQGRRRAVETSCDRWFVLSALHGLLRPEETVQPYDLAMATLSRSERRAWSAQVLEDLRSDLGELGRCRFEVHAGAAYVEYGLVAGLRRSGAVVDLPMAGMSMGRQLAWYGASEDTGQVQGAPGTASTRRADGGTEVAVARAGGRYGPLRDRLLASAQTEVTVSLAEIERWLGAELPASARKHRPWWGNTATSPQAKAWLAAGYRVDRVDLRSGLVTFRSVG